MHGADKIAVNPTPEVLHFATLPVLDMGTTFFANMSLAFSSPLRFIPQI
jgi:hypothetical protein